LVKWGKYALHWHCFPEALALFSGDCSMERGDEIDRADGQENTGDGKQEGAGKIGTQQGRRRRGQMGFDKRAESLAEKKGHSQHA
jgi:hypothetical protein